MRVLIAFDKFKDSMSANAACAAASAALAERHPDWQIEVAPLADGGDGFCEILTGAAGGERIASPATGPRGQRVTGRIGRVPAANLPAAVRAMLNLPAALGHGTAPWVAIVEMAQVSGLSLLSSAERDVWRTSSLGTGELLRATLGAEAPAAILLGVGGSATSDLGLGALTALGLRFLDAEGRLVDPVPAHWPAIARIDGEPLPLPPLFIACDVTNPLLGPRGAAAVYGPQKGLRREDVSQLDDEGGRLARLLCAFFQRPEAAIEAPGAGAAGGIAFGLDVAAGAKLVPGFELVSAWLDLPRRIAAADLVITGEGRFDESSLSGKGPGAVARAALERGKPVHVFAGAVEALPPRAGLSLHAITSGGTPLAQALRDGAVNLRRSVAAAFS
jgi:glycerate kinase